VYFLFSELLSFLVFTGSPVLLPERSVPVLILLSLVFDSKDFMQKNGSWRLPVLLLLLVLSTVLLQALPEAAQLQVRYDRAAILLGEGWRLFSGHLLHLGWVHLALNLAGLGLIVALFWQYWSTLKFVFVFLFSLAAVDVGLWWFSPEVGWYVGLSGILHGLLIAGAVFSFQRERAFSIAVMVIVIGKLAWEQITRTSAGTEKLIGGHVLFDAHLYGFTGGLIAAILLLLSHKEKNT